MGWSGPPVGEQKVFKPKWDLETLEDYKQAAPAKFWEKFPVNLELNGKSLIDPVKLKGLALVLGTENTDRLDIVCKDLTDGAIIGCTGEFRLESVCSNAPSAFEFPREVTDAIACWVHYKFAYGPVPRALVPVGVKINGIMCRQKPNGAARVILNLSAPDGMSVNEGITAGNFPATMSSTAKWLRMLQRTGRGSWLLKVDWQDAYKHVRVNSADVRLQWFEWLGMYFAELCLVFGAASSAGIYDRAAKVVLDFAIRKAKFPRRNVCHLKVLKKYFNLSQTGTLTDLSELGIHSILN